MSGLRRLVMDGDGQHPPSLLPMMIETWRTSGADIIEAVKRRRGGESLTSKFGALTFYVRHGELFAKICGALTLLFLVVRLPQLIRERRKKTS